MPYWCQTSKERLFWAEKWQKWLTDKIHRRTSLNTQHLKNLKQMWSTAAKHHSECSFCQLWTGNWGWHLNGLSKIGQQRKLENHVLAWWVLICAGIGGSGSSQRWWCPPIWFQQYNTPSHKAKLAVNINVDQNLWGMFYSTLLNLCHQELGQL